MTIGDLLIRGISPETHDELKRRAQQAGVSLRSYVARLLERCTEVASLADWVEQFEAPPRHRDVCRARAVRDARDELVSTRSWTPPRSSTCSFATTSGNAFGGGWSMTPTRCWSPWAHELASASAAAHKPLNHAGTAELVTAEYEMLLVGGTGRNTVSGFVIPNSVSSRPSAGGRVVPRLAGSPNEVAVKDVRSRV